ncbi:MAG: cyclase family protein [Deferribacterales bacterium]
MKIIDLTHTIEEGMPVYPGTEPPLLKQANTIKEHGFAEKLITMFSHTGTHMDAPCHILEGRKSLSDIDVNDLYGKACLIDVSGVTGKITADLLKGYSEKLKNSEIAVFYSGWDRYWGEDRYYNDFPVMDIPAAEYLVSTGIKGLAVDVISVDSVDCVNLDVHRVLFKSEIFVAENLKGLERLLGLDFYLGVFPLNIPKGDGSPVRALAFLPERG